MTITTTVNAELRINQNVQNLKAQRSLSSNSQPSVSKLSSGLRINSSNTETNKTNLQLETQAPIRDGLNQNLLKTQETRQEDPHEICEQSILQCAYSAFPSAIGTQQLPNFLDYEPCKHLKSCNSAAYNDVVTAYEIDTHSSFQSEPSPCPWSCRVLLGEFFAAERVISTKTELLFKDNKGTAVNWDAVFSKKCVEKTAACYDAMRDLPNNYFLTN